MNETIEQTASTIFYSSRDEMNEHYGPEQIVAAIRQHLAPVEKERDELRAELDRLKCQLEAEQRHSNEMYQLASSTQAELDSAKSDRDRLQSELESRAFELSPAMVQARNEQLNAELAAEKQKREQSEKACAEMREAIECMIIGACACAIPHPKEREVLEDAVKIARKALSSDAGRNYIPVDHPVIKEAEMILIDEIAMLQKQIELLQLRLKEEPSIRPFGSAIWRTQQHIKEALSSLAKRKEGQ